MTLTAAEAAARLGVKRQTLYAYVSRGLLHRTVATDGRTSLFDPGEIEDLRKGRRANTEGELNTQIATSITRVHDDGLWVRGQDLIELVETDMTFTEVADLVWQSPPGETWPDARSSESITTADSARPPCLDRLRMITAAQSMADPLRHDLSPHSVRTAGRSLITAMVCDLAPATKTSASKTSAGRTSKRRNSKSPTSHAPLSAQLWSRLTGRRSTKAQDAALDAAMALLIDHGLASSTFAARIAASVRADPYSAVTAGLGVIGGPLHGAASAAVHEMLADAATRQDAASAVGDARRRSGTLPGFGHTVYVDQDPRYGALMTKIVNAWADDARLHHVYRTRDVVGERSDALPNVDLALGTLTWLAGMRPDAGETIFAIARTAGWLAHAMEEYEEQPLRFRPKARYTG